MRGLSGGHGGETAWSTWPWTRPGVSRETASRAIPEVSPTDINNDYVLELPSPCACCPPMDRDPGSANFWLIDWSQYDETGTCSHVMTTYHNVADGWYLEIPEDWRDEITISRNDAVTGQRQVVFSLWQGGGPGAGCPF